MLGHSKGMPIMLQSVVEPPPTEQTLQALNSIVAIARNALNGKVFESLDSQRQADPVRHSQAHLESQTARPSAAARARTIYAARRRRDRAFGEYANLLSDPVWDIMLDLFIAHYDTRPVSVTSACIAACVAPTTGLRWLASLEGRGLIERKPDALDKRRQFVSLSPRGVALVEGALAEFER